MSQRKSKGPLQITSLDLESINAMLLQIRDELDHLKGLRGEVKIHEKLSVPTSINILQNVIPNTVTTAPVQVNSQPLLHSSLGGLNTDDHKQYALLAGRSGGQTLRGGGTGADNLKLIGPASVQIGTDLDVQAGLFLSGDITPAQLTASVNDWDPAGLETASTLRISSSVAINITGLARGSDGRVIMLHNVGSSVITLKDESTSSTAEHRFALAQDAIMTADAVVILQYDSTSLRWRAISQGSSGILGSGSDGQITFWTGSPATLTGSNVFKADATNQQMTLNGVVAGTMTLMFQNNGTNIWSFAKQGSTNNFPLFFNFHNSGIVGIEWRNDGTSWTGQDTKTGVLFSAVTTPAQITANQNDYGALIHSGCVLRLSSDAARNITGMTGGFEGRVVIIHNVGSFNITLVDESVLSSAANRFALIADLVLIQDQSCILHYDNTSTRWRCISGPG